MGIGGARPRASRGQADPALDRLFGVSLVPRDGARIVRGSCVRAGDERALRQHQGRSRGAPGSRSHLPDRAPDADTARRRLAAHDVSLTARSAAVLRRHVFSTGTASRHARLHRPAAPGRRVLPQPSRGDRTAGRRADPGIRRAHAAAGRGRRGARSRAARGRARAADTRVRRSNSAVSARRPNFRTR